MLTIHGKRQSRAGRCLWTLEELGLPYRQIATDPFAGETRTQDYLALSPMAKVPVLIDDNVVLPESVAITYYLAAKVNSDLWPSNLVGQARVLQWSSWATTEVEFHFTLIVREMRRAAGGTPDTGVIATCLSAITDTMVALETWLASGHAYVAGDDFTIGDINTAFPVMGVATRIDMTAFPRTVEWLARCTGRPAWQRVLAIDEAALAA